MNYLNEETFAILFSGEYTTDKLLELIENGIVFSNYSYDNFKLKNFIIRLETNKYREIINSLNLNNLRLANIIEEERYKYIKKQIKSTDSNGIFSGLYNKTIEQLNLILPKESMDRVNYELSNVGIIDSILKMYTDKCLYEYVVDLYFKDITFNMLYNLKVMLTYLSKVDDNIIPKERLLFYRQILNFDKLSIDDKKTLIYNYNSNEPYLSNFYDDFSNCKIHSYQSMNNCITKDSNLNKLYHKSLSEKFGVDVYELDGQDFYLYAHTSKIDTDNLEILYKEKGLKETLSISLIGRENICTYKTGENYITIGFNYLDPNNIIHLFNSDSYSNSMSGTTKFQRIYSPNDLLKNSYGYNEILYKKDTNNNLYPSYIICFNEIRDIDIYFSRLKNLPIIKINTIKYRKSGMIEDKLENNYLDSEKAKEIENYSIYF